MRTDSPSTGAHAVHIRGIDGLRALAVLSVILFHFHPTALPGGFSGVDVFFVISGYVVSASLVKHGAEGLRRFITGFYARRILRIYPALIAVLVGSALLQSLFVPASWLSYNTSKTGLLAFLGLSNFALIWFNDGYFSPRVEYNLFTHTWSLAVEEQFYLLAPFLIYGWLKWRHAAGFAGRLARWALPAALVASLAICWRQSAVAPDSAYYLLPSRFWELAAGVLLLQFHVDKGTGDATRARLPALSGLAAVVAGLALSDPKHFPFPWALAAVLGTVLAIAAVARPGGERLWPARLLASAHAVHIGRISYSLYLWHWPIAVLFRWNWGLDTWPKLAAALVLTVLMAELSYRYVETPVRIWGNAQLTSHRRLLAKGAVAIGAGIVVAAGVFAAQPWLTRSVTGARTEWYPERWPAPAGRVEARTAPLRDHRMFVVGDSHTEAYSTMLQMLRDQQGVQVEQFSRHGCPVAGLLEPRPECMQFALDVLAQLRAHAAPGDIVFLASLRMDRLNPGDGRDANAEPGTPAGRLVARQEADTVISAFERAGLTVMIDTPKPVFKAAAFRCSDNFNSGNPACREGLSVEKAWVLKTRQPVMDSIGALAAAHPRLIVWDPLGALCPGARCDAVPQRQPLFFDGDHLSAHGNRVLFPSFLAAIHQVWVPR